MDPGGKGIDSVDLTDIDGKCQGDILPAVIGEIFSHIEGGNGNGGNTLFSEPIPNLCGLVGFKVRAEANASLADFLGNAMQVISGGGFIQKQRWSLDCFKYTHPLPSSNFKRIITLSHPNDSTHRRGKGD